MRQFRDEQGRVWEAAVGRRSGPDFKGRYFFVARPAPNGGASVREEVVLGDLRWNSEKTARRTLETMSEVELRRRLRSARGRAGPRRP